MQHQLISQIVLIFLSTALFGGAIYFLTIYNKLFATIRNLWLRNNLAVLTIGLMVMSAFLALQYPALIIQKGKAGLGEFLFMKLLESAIIILFVFNIVAMVNRIPAVKSMSFIRHHAVIFITIVISALVIYVIVAYFENGMKLTELHGTLLYAYFNAALTALIYTGFSYVERERKRKLNEKEFEVTKLIALKTKAELDALHSKVNPHFLYNALNSIADLSITDNKKARQMTIALADLFRYSINYNDNNYSTIKDELEMAEVYLQIEKIRFEDKLRYQINSDKELDHFLVPRFLMQPLVENAVKHGLKSTGQMTDILLEVSRQEKGLIITVSDTGPLFPESLNPGYGVKSVYDKLDLLFPDQYEIHFINIPRKQVSIFVNKLIKNEPGV